MGTHGLPDIYTLSPRVCGLQALGVYIRQTTRAHGIIIEYILLLSTYINITATSNFHYNRIGGIDGDARPDGASMSA